MANEFVTRTGLIVSGSTFLPAVTTASKGYILSFDDTTKQVYYMSTSSVTVTVPGSDTQIIYNNGGAFGAASNFVFSGSRVGIGTASPYSEVDIRGNVYTSGYTVGFDINPTSNYAYRLTNDSGNSFVNIQGGNFGIGTTSPSARLHISGSTDATQRIIVDGSGNNSSLHLNYNGSNVGFISSYQNSELNIGTSISAFVNFYTNNTERMRITSAGNVGIGTSSPGAKLNVRGGNILIDNTALIQWGFGDGTTYVYGDASNPTGSLKLGTANADRLTVTYAGNIGIGTTSPQNNLHISGAASSDASNIRIDSTTQYGGLVIYENTTLRTILGYGNAGNIFSNAQTDSTSLRGANYLHLGASSVATLTINGGNDYVGIGTTSPSQKLEVSGSGYIIKATANGSDSSYFQAVNGSYDYIAGVATSLGYGLMGMNSNHALAIMTSGSERMRITSDGNVGIGTTSPSEKLHVIGNTIIQSTSTGNGTTAIRVNNSAGTQVLAIGAAGEIIMDNSSKISTVVDPTSTQPQLELYNGGTGYTTLQSSTSYGLLLNPNGGNIGIGKTSPNATLDVNGNVLVTGSLTVSGSSTFTNIGPAVFTGSITQNASTASFGGVVGIGTTTPSYKLDVNGTGRFASGLDVDSYILTRTKLQISNGRLFELIGTSDALNIYDGSAGLSRIYISGSGNVGIGTTTPGYRLEVKSGASNSFFTSFTPSAGSGAISIYQDSNNHPSIYGANASGTVNIVLNTNGVSYLQGGNVIVGGSNDDGATFQVKGNVTATSFTGSFSGSVSSPGSTTQIVYNSGGALAADSGLVYSGSRVGIGISSPSYKLDVDGDIRSGGSDPLVILQPNSGTYAFLQKLNASNGDFLRLYDGTDYSMFWKNTNVGIGTSNPSAKLQTVSSGLGDGGGIRITNSGAGGDDYRIWPTATVNGEGAGKLIFSNNGGNVLTLTSGSNVGIGTTTPAATLDVNGGSIIRGNLILAGGSRYITGDGGDLFIDTENVSGRDILLQTVSGQKVGIGTTAPGAKLDIVSTGAGTEGLRVDGTGGGFAFVVKAGSDYTSHIRAGATVGVNYFTTPPSNGLIVEGNVGVGTTSPAGKLTVKSPGEVSSYGDGFVLERNANSAKLVRIYESGADGYLEVRTGNDSIISKLSGYSGTPSYFLSSVGIGTTAPSSSLHVAGTITAATTVDSGRINLGTQDTDQIGLYRDNTYDLVLLQDASSGNPLYLAGAGDVRVSIDSNNNNTNSKFIVGNNDKKSSNELFSVDESGSGYFSGSLTVQGTITAQKLNVQQITSSVIYSSGSNVFGNSLANTQTFTGSLQVTGSSHYFLGNVGIGITSPNSYNGYSTLTLNGSTGGVVDFESGGSRIATINNPGSGLDIYTMVAAPIVFGTDTTARMTITSGGKVGIGTSTPTSLLYVYNDIAWSAANLNELTGSAMAFKVRSRNSINSEIVMGAMGDDNTGLQAINNSTAAALKFVINPFGGNVGIGTTNPGTMLHVSGGIGATGGSGYNTFGLGTWIGGDGTNGLLYMRNGANWVPGYIDASVLYLNPQSSGNVIINGTTAINSASNRGNLTINGTSAILNFSISNTESGYIFHNGTNLDIAQVLAQPLRFLTTNAERMRIDASGNVGIGTSNPGFKLQVAGNSYISDTLTVDGGGNTLTLRKGTGQAALAFGGASDQASFLMEGVSGGGMQFYTSAGGTLGTPGWTSAMYVSSSGNVGIGTITPSNKLQVVGGVTATSFTGSFSGSITAPGSTTQVAFNSGGTLSADSGFVYSGSRVGIGITNPSSLLHVAGTGKFTSTLFSDSRLQIGVSGNDQTYASIFVGGDLTTGTSQYALLLDPQLSGTSNYGLLANARIKASHAASIAYGVYIANNEILSGASIVNNYGLYIANQTNGSSLNYALYSAGGTSYFAGNVGIGTTSPSALLHVSQPSANTIFRLGNNASYDQFIYFNGNNDWSLGMDYSNSNAFVLSNASSIGTNDRLVVTTGGNVGIGTTTPLAKLHVSGAAVDDIGLSVFQNSVNGLGVYYPAASFINVNGNHSYGIVAEFKTDNAGTNDRPSILFYGAQTTSSWQIGQGNSQWGTADAFVIGYRASNTPSTFSDWPSSYFTVLTGGNVGIGTTTPNQKLSVEGGSIQLNANNVAANYYLNLNKKSGQDGGIVFTRDNAADWQLTNGAGNGDLIFYSYGTSTEAITFKRGTGNVGIGTTSPTGRLTVAPYNTVNSSSIEFTDADNAVISSYYSQTFAVDNTNTQSGRQFVFSKGGKGYGTQTKTMMVIDADSGNVGIDTTSPTAKLQVVETNNSATTYPLIINNQNNQAGDGWGAGIKFSTSNPATGGNEANKWSSIEAFDVNNFGSNSGLSFTVSDGYAKSKAMVINRSGNVGIGTTSSFTTGGTAKLSILGSSVMLTMGASTSDLMYFRQAGAGEYQIQTNNGGNDGNIQLQPYGGKVGIGTTGPNAKLQVVGPSLTVNDENTYGLWVSETGDDTKAIILGYDQGIDAGIITAVDKATAWKNLILQPNLGGVGIGTTSPAYKLQVSGSIAIENQGTTTIESTTFAGSLTSNTNIASVPTASFKAAFFDYYVASGSVNMRAGTVMVVHNNSTSRYTDTSTADIGNTAAVDFTTSVVGGNLVLTANIASGTWEIKTAYRAL